MIATGRSLSFVSALAALTLFVMMETSLVSSHSAYVSDIQLEGKGADGEEVQDDFDGKKNASDSEKPKLIRVPLLPGRYQGRDRRSIDRVDETINEYERNGGYGRKLERNAATSVDRTFPANDTSAIVLKGAKKNHKKLKLARMQSKSSRIKEHPRDQDSGKYMDEHSPERISKRHVDYNAGRQESIIGNTNQISVDKTKLYRDGDYYARRQAVMENFYARQRDIEKKYADQRSTTTRSIVRYNLLAEIDSNKVSSPVNVDRKYMHKEENVENSRNDLGATSYVSSTTKAPKRIRETKRNSSHDDNGNADDSEYYDEYEDETETTQNDQTTTQTTPNSLNNAIAKRDDGKTFVRGDCTLGTLIYQHSLFFNLHGALPVESDVQISIDGSVCIACIKVESRNAVKSALSIAPVKDSNGNVSTVKLSAMGVQDEQLSLVMKIFVVQKKSDRCRAI